MTSLNKTLKRALVMAGGCFLFVLLVSYAPNLETGLQAQDTHQRPTRSMKHVHDHETIWSRMWRMLFAKKLTEDDIQAIRTDVDDARREARRLSAEGQYIEALRLLFDAMYSEERTRTLLAFQRGEEFPITAAGALLDLQETWIREGTDPLLHWFRDPYIPLQEKLTCLQELRCLATTKRTPGEDVVFRGQYRGALIRLLTDPAFTRDEKFDVLDVVEWLVQTRYTSTAQQDQIKEEILQIRQEAEQRFLEKQYVEAFVLLSDADRKAQASGLARFPGDDHDDLIAQEVRLMKAFVHADESPLMHAFKDRQRSIGKRQFLLYVLQYTPLPDTAAITLQGETYTGTLVQLLAHSDIDRLLKYSILGNIEVEILKQEPGYLPEWRLRENPEFFHLWQQYKETLEQHIENGETHEGKP